MIRINLKYFGELAEKTGCSEEQLDLELTNLSSALELLHKKYSLADSTFMVAVNQEQITQIEIINLKNNDEVALLPPFAGG